MEAAAIAVSGCRACYWPHPPSRRRRDRPASGRPPVWHVPRHTRRTPSSRRARSPPTALQHAKEVPCAAAVHITRGFVQSVAGKVNYPIVPGHELSGVCTAMGKAVTRVKVGDAVGVGVMVDACLQCDPCKAGEEQNCKKGNVSTYNGTDKYGRAASPCGYTLGGYTSKMVVHERFAIVVPPNYPLEFAGPVMCSGVTLFDPLRRHGATTGTKVGIIGLGGLGQVPCLRRLMPRHFSCPSRLLLHPSPRPTPAVPHRWAQASPRPWAATSPPSAGWRPSARWPPRVARTRSSRPRTRPR